MFETKKTKMSVKEFGGEVFMGGEKGKGIKELPTTAGVLSIFIRTLVLPSLLNREFNNSLRFLRTIPEGQKI